MLKGVQLTNPYPNKQAPKKISLLSMAVGRPMNTLVNVAPAYAVNVDRMKAWNQCMWVLFLMIDRRTAMDPWMDMARQRTSVE